MQLVYEKNDLPVAVFYIIQHRFQPFLELTPVFRTGHQCPHIQGKNLLIFQPLRHITSDDTLGQPFRNRRLTHTRLSDQHRVVLRFPGKDADHIANFIISANDRIELLIPGPFHQILPVFLQRIIGCFRIVGGDSLIATHRRKRLQKALFGDAELPKDFLDFSVGMLQHGQKQVFYGNILIAQRPGFILRTDQNLV